MAKGSLKAAKKYARALAESYPVSELDGVDSALKSLALIWRENKDLRGAMINPAFKINERIEAAKVIASKLRAGDQKFLNFLAMLSENGRIADVVEISEALSAHVAHIKKLLALKVSSAFELSSSEKERFSSHIQKEFGSMASLDWEVDPELIGGMRVRAGDKLLDGTVRGALERLEESLLES